MLTTVEGIILSARRYGESSKIITVYTSDFGFCTLLAKGARTTKSTSGVLEPLSCCMLTFHKKPHRDMHTLSGAESVFPTRAITDDFNRLTVGLMIAEAISKTHRNEEEQPQFYEVVRECIIALIMPEVQPNSLLVAFYIRLAEHLGIELNLINCGITSKPVRYQQAEKFYFSLAEGCIIAPDLPSPKKYSIFFPAELRALQNLSVLPLEHSFKVNISNEMVTKFLLFFGRYFSLHLGMEVVAYSLHSLQNDILHSEQYLS